MSKENEKEILTLHQKMLEIKKNIGYLQKNKESHNYSYVTPSFLLSKVNPLLNEHGVILITNVVKVESRRIFSKFKSFDYYENKEKKSQLGKVFETKYDVWLKYVWVDTESDEKIEIDWFSSGVNGDEKGFGSALTYAERYFLMKQFNIATDDDDPDSFENKHMTPEEREMKRTVLVNKAVSEIGLSSTVEELNLINSKYYSIREEKFFKNSMKDKITEINSGGKTLKKGPAVIGEKKPDMKEELKKPEPATEELVEEGPVEVATEETSEEIAEKIPNGIESSRPNHEAKVIELPYVITDKDSVIKYIGTLKSTAEVNAFWNNNKDVLQQSFIKEDLDLIGVAFRTQFDKYKKS